MTLNNCEEIATSLVRTLSEVRGLTGGFSEDQSKWKPPTGEFSVVENICHLRDIEVEGYAVRIRKILLEGQPFLMDLDGARMAKERDYNNQELDAALDAFAHAREECISTILGLSSEQLMRTGTLENTGSITLADLLEMMREHDAAHIAELNTLRMTLTRPDQETLT